MNRQALRGVEVEVHDWCRIHLIQIEKMRVAPSLTGSMGSLSGAPSETNSPGCPKLEEAFQEALDARFLC